MADLATSCHFPLRIWASTCDGEVETVEVRCAASDRIEMADNTDGGTLTVVAVIADSTSAGKGGPSGHRHKPPTETGASNCCGSCFDTELLELRAMPALLRCRSCKVQ
mmetsp:Transcript_11056/g.20835  ORF Transcript_11056/g.20835 Transcript_11056/m.20835 type:complete len:108 (-) Transcript_11056:163-486(-)